MSTLTSRNIPYFYIAVHVVGSRFVAHEQCGGMQARLQQAESLIQQQRLTIDGLYRQQGRNSKHSIPVGHLRQSENDYWRSWLQSSADCTAVVHRLDQHNQPLRDILTPLIAACSAIPHATSHDIAPAAVGGEAQTGAGHVASFGPVTSSGRNSVAASSATSSRNARQHHQRRKPTRHHQAAPLSSNASLVNVLQSDAHDDVCPLSGCHSCGWKPGSTVVHVVGVCHSHSCSEDIVNS